MTYESMQSELMLHIERIVRPVRAFQSRKLRMRNELLMHLQAAIEQERAGCQNETEAIESAKNRLGEPDRLTGELQRSVPMIERVLLARIPFNQKFDRMEMHAGRKFGFPPTFIHSAILMSAAAGVTVSGLIITASRLFVDRSALAGDASGGERAVLVLAWIIANALFGIYWAFSASIGRASVQRIAGLVAASVALQVSWTLIIHVTFGGGHILSLADLGWSLGISAISLLLLIPTGRAVGALRRPYDPWLKLDIANS